MVKSGKVGGKVSRVLLISINEQAREKEKRRERGGGESCQIVLAGSNHHKP